MGKAYHAKMTECVISPVQALLIRLDFYVYGAADNTADANALVNRPKADLAAQGLHAARQ